MSILKIAKMGHPALRIPAKPVADPSAPEIKALVADMIDTMRDAPGIGLAAPQIRVSKRVVVFYVPEARIRASRYDTDETGDELDGPQGLTVMVNPEIMPLGEEMRIGPESCLSLPGLRGQVKRYDHIRYRFFDLDGKEQSVEAKGFHARVVQHECDHLDGILYPMRMDNLSSFGFTEEIEKAAALVQKESAAVEKPVKTSQHD